MLDLPESIDGPFEHSPEKVPFNRRGATPVHRSLTRLTFIGPATFQFFATGAEVVLLPSFWRHMAFFNATHLQQNVATPRSKSIAAQDAFDNRITDYLLAIVLRLLSAVDWS